MAPTRASESKTEKPMQGGVGVSHWRSRAGAKLFADARDAVSIVAVAHPELVGLDGDHRDDGDRDLGAGPAEYLLTLRATAANATPVEASSVLRCEGQHGFTRRPGPPVTSNVR
jgi:hypothetical protein